MSDKKFIKVQGDIMWASLTEPNKMSNKFQVSICNLSDKAIKALQDEGIEPSTKEKNPEMGVFVTPKSNFAIDAHDLDGNPITVKIANGSKGIALLHTYMSKTKKGMVCLGITSLTVTDLKAYNPAVEEDLTEDVL
jgi:hypothetical protein